MRQQYLEIKRQYPDAILFFRLGDFYETFDADAETTARELDIVLTSRSFGKGARAPMAGIPHHAVDNYLSRLIDKGYHVAICEQVGSEPVRGLMPRKVVRVVTPGTVIEPGMLAGDRNNYLAAITLQDERAGFAYVDITTGEFATTETTGAGAAQFVRNEIARIGPAEILLAARARPEIHVNGVFTTPLSDWRFEESIARETLLRHFDVRSLDGFGLAGKPFAIRAAGAIVQYLAETQAATLELLTNLHTYSSNDFMTLDANTRRNLELTETLRGGRTHGSLLGILDLTVTPMGGRLLRRWVNQPLLDAVALNARLDSVGETRANELLRASLRDSLKTLGDLERLTNRVLGGSATPRDLGAIRDSLSQLPKLQEAIAAADAEVPALRAEADKIDRCEEVARLLREALAVDAPAKLEKPGVILPGWSAELDGVMAASREAREWVAGLEPAERERTGIKSLKVGFNKVFGYYIEVTRAHSEQVPEHYIRKQTLVNAERYITPELKEYETLVLNAEEEIVAIEQRLFTELCAQVAAQATRLLRTAQALAQLDVLAALGEAAAVHNFVRPRVVTDDVLEIRQGRHPVVEAMLPGGERFIPNEASFGSGERIRVITGPNMSGKSTYLRQTALIVLLAQIGSFVPAESATIGIVDRIFTRSGAQDEIHAGQSTFMVEMVEAANILRHATARSLLILDEIGRGTSTYDGLSLAWSIVEYIHNHPRLRAKTLFATHYHELAELAHTLPAVANFNVAVSDEGEEVVFLHRIVAGAADRSYGIHVAKLAGMPRPVVNRAEEILRRLEKSGGRADSAGSDDARQLKLFPEVNPLLAELAQLDLTELTPLEALNRLFEWQDRFGGREEQN